VRKREEETAGEAEREREGETGRVVEGERGRGPTKPLGVSGNRGIFTGVLVRPFGGSPDLRWLVSGVRTGVPAVTEAEIAREDVPDLGGVCATPPRR
jgi:hypothetical protein